MFEKIARFGMTCGLLACATEEHPRADDADLRAQSAAAAQDAGADAGQRNASAASSWDLPAPPHTPSSVADPGMPGPAYPGKGWIVHEWGTNTVVVGSDGKLQRGLHHEEEDLPAFVYDRLSQGEFSFPPSIGKMETPVDYFYSDTPRTATVSVAMPNGVLTQWYPAVNEFAPPIMQGGFGRAELVDPYFERSPHFEQQHCIDKYTQLADGRLDWGPVEVLARDAELSPPLPDAPLERFTWSYARDVAANPIRVRNPSAFDSAAGQVQRGPQSERFLFYRGLGNFSLPAEVMVWGNSVKLTNRTPWPMHGSVFVLNVDKDRASFRESEGELAPSGEHAILLPAPEDAMPLDGFVDALDAAMTTALLGTGLYKDEAVAMVRTWRRQWFRTPGVRVLYFAPAPWIDREVPITIEPAPDTLLRVMVLRVEVLVRGTEDSDLKFVAALDGGPNQQNAERYFRELGRFAEPRLRRALENLGTVSAEAAAFLAEIEHPNASFAMGE